MSRPLTLICCVVALTAGVGVALAAASTARRGTYMIVCPLEPNDTITTTCCGPPVVTAAASAAFVCCGTPQPIACPIGLTLSSSADPSVAGQKVTLTGHWPGNTAGQAVELFQELPGAETFTKAAHTKTGSLGDFKFVRKEVETNRKWYVAVGSERSVTVDQRVKAVVTLRRSGNRAFGRVTPDHSGERVFFEHRSTGGWHVLARPRLNHQSAYSVTLPKPSVFGDRTVFPGDRRNVRSWVFAPDVSTY